MTTLAYMAAKKDKRAPGDLLHDHARLSEPGELGVFLDEPTVDALEKKMAERGYLEGSRWPAPSTCCAPTT